MDSYRTPIENVLEILPIEARESLREGLIEKIKKLGKQEWDYYSYALSGEQRKHLTKVGIPLHPNGCLPHPHPACKTIENFMLFNLVANTIKSSEQDGSSYCFLSMKDQKFQTFQSGFNESDVNINLTLENKVFDSLDRMRYGSEWPKCKDLVGHINYLKKKKNKNFFIHDEIHHWSRDDTIKFLDVLKPSLVLATAVFPLEVAFGSTISLNPHLYEFEVTKDKVFFFPDGNSDGKYEQTKDFWLLRSKRIKAEVDYSVTFLKTIGAHHLILLERCGRNLESKRFFNDFLCFNPTINRNLFIKCSRVRLHKLRLQKMVMYLLSLKKPDLESAIAKLRQLSGDNIDPFELAFVIELGKRLIEKPTDFHDSFFHSFFLWVEDKLVESNLALLTNQKLERRFQRFLASGLSHTFCVDLDNDSFVFDEETIEMPISEIMDDVWSKGMHEACREPQLYALLMDQIVDNEFCANRRIVYSLNSHNNEYLILNTDIDNRRIFLNYNYTKMMKEGILSNSFLGWKGEIEDQVFEYSSVTPMYVELGPLIQKTRKGYMFTMPKSFINVLKRSREQRLPKAKMVYTAKDSDSDEVTEVPSFLGHINLPKIGLFSKFLEDEIWGTPEVETSIKLFARTECSIEIEHNKVKSESWIDYLDIFGDFNVLVAFKCGKKDKFDFHSIREKKGKCEMIMVLNLLGKVRYSFRNRKTGCVTKFHLDGYGGFMIQESLLSSHSFSTETVSEKRICLMLRKEEIDSEEAKDAEIEELEKMFDEVEDNTGSESFNDPDLLNSAKILDNMKEKIQEGKKTCFFKALSLGLKMEMQNLLVILLTADQGYWSNVLAADLGADAICFSRASTDLQINLRIYENEVKMYDFAVEGEHETVDLVKIGDHVELHQVGSKVKSLHDLGDNATVGSAVVNEIKTFNNCSTAEIELKSDYADKLRISFRTGKAGAIMGDSKSSRMDFKVPNFVVKKKVMMISGLPGSGKSFGVEAIFKRYGKSGRLAVVSPRRQLKEQWKNSSVEKLPIFTFEVFLNQKVWEFEIVFFDEVGLYPPGYFDLIAAMFQISRQTWVMIGDPLQAAYHNKRDDILNAVPDCFSRLKLEGELNYLYYSRRLGEWANQIFEFKSYNVGEKWKFHGEIFGSADSLMGKCIEGDVDRPDLFLVASNEDKKLVPSINIPVLTFGESQGLTVGRSAIVLSAHSQLAENHHWFVAVTRAVNGFCFINHLEFGVKGLIKRKGDSIPGRILSGIKITDAFLTGMFALKGIERVNRINLSTVGTRVAEDRLEGDPWLKPYLFLGEIPEAEICTLFEPIPPEPESKTHLPLAPSSFEFAELFEVMRAKEFREFKVPFDMSSQFSDIEGRGRKVDVQPMAFEAIYPRHNASDEVTFWAAVKKRLRFSRPEVERAKFEKNYAKGNAIFENFIKYVPLDPYLEVDRLDQCQMDFEWAKLKKDKATIAGHAERSCADWDTENIFLFMKSQLCTKLEKRFCDAKAGQTLACFSHLVLCHFSKWCRYIDYKVSKVINRGGNNFYIHTRKNFDELNMWVTKQNFDRVCTESDYEAFDASQDSIILGFEISLMRYLNLPIELIESYKHIKFNLRCRLGGFAIMRFTGEFCTFLFNTLSNMAFTFMRYHVPKGTPIAFAGDDMCAALDLKEKHDFEELLADLSLKAKVQKTRKPTFCGWFLTSYGIVKSPKLIWERFLIAKERMKLKECLESYTIEACYAYELGDRLFDILEEEDIHYYQCINRLIVKNLNSISLKIKRSFSKAVANLNGDNTSEQVHQGIQEFWESDGSDSDGLNLP
uniref:RNA-dependent RNA polymerase n=1 Tax=Agapanthus virus A TaxID=2838150 RepID=A0A8E7NDX7_9VIRU|nr:RNA-dependent RNA polymerase [Agapanthus virus A]